jgi:hypothetical protein
VNHELYYYRVINRERSESATILHREPNVIVRAEMYLPIKIVSHMYTVIYAREHFHQAVAILMSDKGKRNRKIFRTNIQCIVEIENYVSRFNEITVNQYRKCLMNK